MQAYQIFARNVDETAGTFSLGRSFDLGAGTDFLVGSGTEVSFVVPECPGRLLRIFVEAGQASLEVFAPVSLPVTCNQQAVASGVRQPLLSGDEVQAGAWAFRVVRRRPSVPFSPGADALAWVAKALVAGLLLFELLLAVFGPQQFRSGARFQRELELQRLEQSLDRLAVDVELSKNRTAAALPVEQAAYAALRQELARMRAYVRGHRDRISMAQAQDLRRRVVAGREDFQLLEQKKAFLVPENPDIEDAVVRALQAAALTPSEQSRP